MKAKRSYLERGKPWTACCECDRGGNGSAKDKCASGWKCKKWNYLGCFMGDLMPKYDNLEERK